MAKTKPYEFKNTGTFSLWPIQPDLLAVVCLRDQTAVRRNGGGYGIADRGNIRYRTGYHCFSTSTTPDDGSRTNFTTPAQAEPDIEKVYVEELEDHVLIHFPYNSTRKEDNAAIDDYLSRLARQLVSNGGSVTLTGHTDVVGDSKTNEKFAMRRAKNIRDILIAKGVKKSQITTKSYGERKPVASNDNPRGRYKNRRVEIRVK